MNIRSDARARFSKRGRPGRPALKAKKSRPVWEELLRIARSIPEPDLHKLPTDLAAHHDHYLYGSRET
ncbi:MAG: hypothetical protein HXY51_02485 [Nitrospirae bacterium]|nr:hypothetical protein [Nitrospirota bacterium]